MSVQIPERFEVFKQELGNQLLSLNRFESIQSPTQRDEVEMKLKSAKDLLGRIEKARKAMTSPMDALKKQIMDAQKDITRSLTLECARVTEELQKYYDNQLVVNDLKRKEIEERHQKAHEASNDLDDVLQADVDKSMSEALVDDAERGFSRRATWVLEDLSKVPEEYLILDTKKVEAAVKAGEQIAGIKIYEKAVRTGKG